MTVNLDHIILSVADAENSVRFYHKVFGFKYEPVGLVRVSSTLVLQLSAHGSRKNGSSIYFRDPDGYMLEIMQHE
jgi:catechol 2,3-dioxygenase-like lactoylglutathione lyase family enzyme